MHAFHYQRPTDITAAQDALRRGESKVIAGGMSLVPIMRHRLTNPSLLVDLGAISALSGIADTSLGLRIGAMTPHVAVSRSDLVHRKIPALSQLAGGIGD